MYRLLRSTTTSIGLILVLNIWLRILVVEDYDINRFNPKSNRMLRKAKLKDFYFKIIQIVEESIN